MSRLVCRVWFAQWLLVSVAPAAVPRSSRSAWRAWRSSSSVIWCRSCARAVRLVAVSAAGRVHSPRSAMSCSSWATAAIVDVTGCCPVSSNAVVIQGILASTTDSPGPGTGPGSGMWTTSSGSICGHHPRHHHATTDNAVHTTAMPAPTSRAEPFRTHLHRMRVGSCLCRTYVQAPGRPVAMNSADSEHDQRTRLTRRIAPAPSTAQAPATAYRTL